MVAIITWQLFAPASRWPITRSPKPEARPFVASILRVDSRPSLAMGFNAAAMSLLDWPCSASCLNAVATGIKTSSMVFSPACALPRCIIACTPASNASAICNVVMVSLVLSDLLMLIKKLANKGPEAPPMVLSNFMPILFSASAAGRVLSSSARLAIASQPRFILM